MSKRDYYEILGISKKASDEEIKKSYRKLAMQYHPDRNPGNAEAEKKFKEATEAYENLKDPQKRAAYDTYGHDAAGGHGGGHGHQGFNNADFNGFDFNDIFSNFSDIFGEMGGARGGKKKSSSIRGSDIRYNIEITLEEAFLGTVKNIAFTIPTICGTCNGSGGEKNEKPSECTTCQGTGKVRMQQGFFIVERSCGACHGSGQIIKNPCKTCRGEGRVNKEKKLAVKIPAGVDEGNKIRLSGEGEAGSRGGQAGDLYVFIAVAKHKFFNRDGDDLYCEVPIRFTSAALGGSIEVPIIDGTKAQLKIPEGTQTAQQFRLKGKGMSVLNSGGRMGDMFVKVFVEVPKKLSAEEKSLLQKLDEVMLKRQSSSKDESIFKKASDFFK